MSSVQLAPAAQHVGALEKGLLAKVGVNARHTPATRTDTAACAAPGPSSDVGLHLRSYRVEGGLEATLQLDKKYQAFPGAAAGLFPCCRVRSARPSLVRLGERHHRCCELNQAFSGAARSSATVEYKEAGPSRVRLQAMLQINRKRQAWPE